MGENICENGRKHMRKLKISGSFITDPFDRLFEQQRFNQGLYTSINKNVDTRAKIENFLKGFKYS